MSLVLEINYVILSYLILLLNCSCMQVQYIYTILTTQGFSIFNKDVIALFNSCTSKWMDDQLLSCRLNV